MRSQHLFRGSIVNYPNTREDRPALEVIGEFTTCAAKSYWIALVLTGDEDTAARIIFSGIHMASLIQARCLGSGCAPVALGLSSRPVWRYEQMN
jgi:hypothetical protein